MTVIAAWGPEARARGGLEMARLISASSGEDLVVCCVIPDRWRVLP